ncbi:MAG TPA: tetratricopeptide repeat protein, partial [Terriglobales bacterium]|nr:tetratricopeptide repeat protein [Terriglobales bacterium]
PQYAQKVLDTADIVREAIYRQPPSVQSYRDLPMTNPAPNDELYKRASYLMWKERWSEAIKLLRPECTPAKRDWRSSWNLGWCYFKTGKLDSARKQLIRATRLSPESPACKWALGIVYLDQNQFRKAEAVLEDSLKLKESHNTRIALALAYLSQGKVAKAENVHLEGIRLRPKKSEGYESYAVFLSDVGREVEARKMQQKACRLRSVN